MKTSKQTLQVYKHKFMSILGIHGTTIMFNSVSEGLSCWQKNTIKYRVCDECIKTGSLANIALMCSSFDFPTSVAECLLMSKDKYF